jgi:hypothetical protein
VLSLSAEADWNSLLAADSGALRVLLAQYWSAVGVSASPKPGPTLVVSAGRIAELPGTLFAQQGCRSPQGVEAGAGFTRSVLWTVEENGDANAAGAFQNASAASTKTEMVCSASP